jgi:hypothetical protein
MNCSLSFIRSTIVGSLALLSLFGCERSDTQQGGAAGDATRTTTGTGTTSNRDMTGTGTTGAADTTHGTANERGGVGEQPGDDAIERTGGRDAPMGAGGAAQRDSTRGSTNMGEGGHGGAGKP